MLRSDTVIQSYTTYTKGTKLLVSDRLELRDYVDDFIDFGQLFPSPDDRRLATECADLDWHVVFELAIRWMHVKLP